MTDAALSVEQRSGVVYLTLSTPGCPVNIFSSQMAAELLDVLDALDSTARAVVVRSGKPGSFVNGAGVMLASALKRPEDVQLVTSTIRKAYQAFEDLDIPTVAAIRGNCYGCGVEFALRARYRVAATGYDTHFYMTELADYLFVPTFGATQRLPRLLGLEQAVRFLLWGEKWPAEEALARGLLDGLASDSDFDRDVEQIASDLAREGASTTLRGSVPVPRRGEDIGQATRDRIGTLPPAYRAAYAACYELMERAAGAAVSTDVDYADEMLASGQSAMTSVSKAAVTYFFVSQTSELACLRGSEPPRSFHVSRDVSPSAPRLLYDELKRRRVGDVTFDGDAVGAAPSRELRFVGWSRPGGRSRPEVGAVAVIDALHVGSLDWMTDVILYGPFWRTATRFFEVACRERTLVAQSTYRLLLKAGVKGVITQPGESFVTNDLLRAYLEPQIAFLEAGGAPEDLAVTLRDFGFVRLAGDWLSGSDLEACASLLGGERGAEHGTIRSVAALRALPRAHDAVRGTARDAVKNAVLVSLIAFAKRSVEIRTLMHPSLVDVIARELIDFPIGHASLCRYATTVRAKDLLAAEAGFRALVPSATVESVREYVRNGREYYG